MSTVNELRLSEITNTLTLIQDKPDYKDLYDDLVEERNNLLKNMPQSW